jgi:hypothetical protein
MNFMRQQLRTSFINTTLVLLLLGFSVAQAATIDYSFNNVVSGTPASSSPWLDLKISDTALVGNQTLTGIFLNLPTVLSSSLTGISISNGTIGGSPSAFISGTGTSATNSVFSATQSITSSALGQTTGSFDIYVKFAAGKITGPAGAGTLQESFDLTFAGAVPIALSFLTQSASVNNGPTLYALAALTNAGGTGGSGIANISASPVPLPAGYLLMMGGLGLFRLVNSGGRKTKA